MAIKTATAYAVLIWNKDMPEKAFLGHSLDMLPQMYSRRRDAVAYKKKCVKSGLKNVKVVRVGVTYEFELPKELRESAGGASE